MITLILGASLRHRVPGAARGPVALELAEPLSVRDLLARIDIRESEARLVLINHRKAGLGTPVRPGDRVAIFPPELAFNLYVASGLAHGGEEDPKCE